MSSSKQVEGLAFGRSRDTSSGERGQKKEMGLGPGNNQHHYSSHCSRVAVCQVMF